jgi:hypothetical protein
VRRVRHLARTLGQVPVALLHTHPSGSVELSQSDRLSLEYSDLPWVVAAPGQQADPPRLRFAAYAPGCGGVIPIVVLTDQGEQAAGSAASAGLADARSHEGLRQPAEGRSSSTPEEQAGGDNFDIAIAGSHRADIEFGAMGRDSTH